MAKDEQTVPTRKPNRAYRRKPKRCKHEWTVDLGHCSRPTLRWPRELVPKYRACRLCNRREERVWTELSAYWRLVKDG